MNEFNIKNKISSIISVILFIAVIVLLPIYFYITNDGVKYEIDLGEKRQLKTEIEVENPDRFFASVEEYYDDHIPFRSFIINIDRNINDYLNNVYKNTIEAKLREIRFKNLKKKNNNYDLEEGEAFMDRAVDIFFDRVLLDNEIDVYDGTIDFPVKYLNGRVILGQSDWMFLNSINIDYYTGKNIFKTEDEYDEYIRKMVTLNDICKEKGKTIVFMVCPEKEEIYKEYMPTMEIKDEEELPIKIKRYVEENSDVKFIYPKDALLEAKKNYRVYKKYDTHWNLVGAYVALGELYKSIGIDYTPINEIRVKKVPETIKDLTLLGNVNPDSYTDSFEYLIDYKENINITPVPIRYVKGQTDLAEAYDTNSLNHKSIFFYGDSYRLFISNFIVKDFEHTTVMQRECEFSKDLIDRLKDSDIIVIEEVSRNTGWPFLEMLDKVKAALMKK